MLELYHVVHVKWPSSVGDYEDAAVSDVDVVRPMCVFP